MLNYQLWAKLTHKDEYGTIKSTGTYKLIVDNASKNFIGMYDRPSLLQYCAIGTGEPNTYMNKDITIVKEAAENILVADAEFFTVDMIGSIVWATDGTRYRLTKYLTVLRAEVEPLNNFSDGLIEMVSPSDYAIDETPARSALIKYYDRIVYNTIKTFTFTLLDETPNTISEFSISPKVTDVFGYRYLHEDGITLSKDHTLEIQFTLQSALENTLLENIEFFKHLHASMFTEINLGQRSFNTLSTTEIEIPNGVVLPLLDPSCSTFIVQLENQNGRILDSVPVSSIYKSDSYSRTWSVNLSNTNALAQAHTITLSVVRKNLPSIQLRLPTEIASHLAVLVESRINLSWTFSDVSVLEWVNEDAEIRNDIFKSEIYDDVVTQPIVTGYIATGNAQTYVGTHEVRSVIETGYLPKTGDIIEIDIQFCEAFTTKPKFIGCSGNTDEENCFFGIDDVFFPTLYRWVVGAITTVFSSSTIDSGRHVHRLDTLNGEYFIDGAQEATFTPPTFEALTRSFSLICMNANGTLATTDSTVVLYSFKVWRAEALMLHLVPCQTDIHVSGTLETPVFEFQEVGVVDLLSGNNYGYKGPTWSNEYKDHGLVAYGNYNGMELYDTNDLDDFEHPDYYKFSDLSTSFVAVTACNHLLYYVTSTGNVYKSLRSGKHTTLTPVVSLNKTVSTMHYCNHRFYIGKPDGTIDEYDPDWNFKSKVLITQLNVYYTGYMVGRTSYEYLTVYRNTLPSFAAVRPNPTSPTEVIVETYGAPNITAIADLDGQLYVGTGDTIFRQHENGRWEMVIPTYYSEGYTTPTDPIVGLSVFNKAVHTCRATDGWQRWHSVRYIPQRITSDKCADWSGMGTVLNFTFDNEENCFWILTSNALYKQPLLSITKRTSTAFRTNAYENGPTFYVVEDCIPTKLLEVDITFTCNSGVKNMLFSSAAYDSTEALNLIIEEGYLKVRHGNVLLGRSAKKVLLYGVQRSVQLVYDFTTSRVRCYVDKVLVISAQNTLGTFLIDQVTCGTDSDNNDTGPMLIYYAQIKLDGRLFYQLHGDDFLYGSNLFPTYLDDITDFTSSFGEYYTANPILEETFSNNWNGWALSNAIIENNKVIVTSGIDEIMSIDFISEEVGGAISLGDYAYGYVEFDYTCTVGTDLNVVLYNPSENDSFTTNIASDTSVGSLDTSGEMAHVLFYLNDPWGEKFAIGSTHPFTGTISNLKIVYTPINIF